MTLFIHKGSLENFANIIYEAEMTLANANEYFLRNGQSKENFVFSLAADNYCHIYLRML